MAGDPDDDPLTFSATGLPNGARIDPLTGRIAFVPHSFQAGTYEGIVISVSDGHRTSSEEITLVIEDTNRAPVFLGGAERFGREGSELSFRLLAVDPDGDAVRFAPLAALPPGAVFDAATGVFTWTPGFLQAGVHALSFAAFDSRGASAERTILLEIADTNRAPVLNLANRAVAVGETLTVTLEASDPDADNVLVLSIEDLPPNATFDAATSVLTFTPGLGQVGDVVFRVVADDGTDRTVAPLVVRVSREPQGPVATIDLTPSFPVLPGQTVILSALASGFEPIASRVLTVDGTEVPLDALNRGRFVPDAPGRHEAVLVVTDTSGRSTTTRKMITVRDASDTRAPVALLDVVEGTVLTDRSITGRISDASLDRWTLELVHTASGTVRSLASGTQALDGILTSWRAGSVPSGFYSLRLTATDLAGRRTEVLRPVEVPPAEPVGLRRAVTDATVELGGVAVALSRVHDSRESGEALTADRFGTGWRAAWSDLALDAPGLTDPARALRDGDRLHLTAPDGTRLVFTARIEEVAVAGARLAEVTFTASDPAYALSLEAPPILRADGSAFFLDTGLPFNPFTSLRTFLSLTDAGGTVWEARGNGSVKAIRAPGGEVLVSDTGLIARDGTAVEVFTGGDGGIGGMDLPDGARHIYLRDAAGRLILAGDPAPGDHPLRPMTPGPACSAFAGAETGVGVLGGGRDWSAPVTRRADGFMGTLVQARRAPVAADARRRAAHAVVSGCRKRNMTSRGVRPPWLEVSGHENIPQGGLLGRPSAALVQGTARARCCCSVVGESPGCGAPVAAWRGRPRPSCGFVGSGLVATDVGGLDFALFEQAARRIDGSGRGGPRTGLDHGPQRGLSPNNRGAGAAPGTAKTYVISSTWNRPCRPCAGPEVIRCLRGEWQHRRRGALDADGRTMVFTPDAGFSGVASANHRGDPTAHRPNPVT